MCERAPVWMDMSITDGSQNKLQVSVSFRNKRDGNIQSLKSMFQRIKWFYWEQIHTIIKTLIKIKPVVSTYGCQKYSAGSEPFNTQKDIWKRAFWCQEVGFDLFCAHFFLTPSCITYLSISISIPAATHDTEIKYSCLTLKTNGFVKELWLKKKTNTKLTSLIFFCLSCSENGNVLTLQFKPEKHRPIMTTWNQQKTSHCQIIFEIKVLNQEWEQI